MTKTRAARGRSGLNHGYYGQLCVVVDGQLQPLYTTPVFNPHTGLAGMADHLRRLAIDMNASSYQLRRCLAGTDRAQGCVMMLTSESVR